MVELEPGESLTFTQDGVEVANVGKGTLYLTDRRLVFEKVTGFFSKKRQMALNLRLEAVTFVSSHKDDLTVEFGQARHRIDVRDAEKWARTIEDNTRKLSKAEVQPQQPHVPTTMAKPTETVFCPYCGARMTKGTATCPSCGRQV